jgi:hypothetical protein
MGFNFGSLIGIGGMLVGGIVGSIIAPGYGTAIGMSIGGLLAGFAGSYLFPAEPQKSKVKPPEPMENRVQISSYGAPVPILRGTKRYAGNLAWMSDVREKAYRTKHRQNGERYYQNYREYYASMFLLFCEGEIKQIQRVWVNNEVWYDVRDANDPLYAGDPAVGAANQSKSAERLAEYAKIYLGTASQLADPTYEAAVGAGNAPAFRGRCGLMLKDFPIGEFGQLPRIEAEIVRTGLGTAGEGGGGEWDPYYAYGYYSMLGVSGTWASGYRPTKIKITWKHLENNGSMSFGLYYVGSEFADISRDDGVSYFGTYVAGNTYSWEEDISGEVQDKDIAKILISMATDHNITKIEFYSGGTWVDRTLDSYWTPQTYSGGQCTYIPGEPPYQQTHELASAAIEELCTLAGLAAADVDASALDADTLYGYGVSRQMTARLAIEPLREIFAAELVELDWKLVFAKRGAAALLAIAAGELAAHEPGSARPEPLVEDPRTPSELPTHLVLSYESRQRDFDIASQQAVRVDKSPQVMSSNGVGIVMTDGQAKQAAEIMLDGLWLDRRQVRFATGLKYLYLAPNDVVTVDGRNVRILSMTRRGAVVEFTAAADDAAARASAAEADDISISAEDLSRFNLVPSALFLEIPVLSAIDDNAGVYVVFFGAPGAYYGGALLISHDSGGTWEDGAVADTLSGYVGDCTTTLPNGTPGVIDYAASLTVDLADSGRTLASATDEQLFAGYNLAAVGSAANGWELIQFKTATAGSGNSYTLTGLVRGLYGTAFEMAGHGSGEGFVLLYGLPSIDRVYLEAALIGVARLYQLTDMRRVAVAGSEFSYTGLGRGLLPMPPSGIAVGFETDGDAVITWRRGDRLFFTVADLGDGELPMSEASQSYRVRIYNSGDTLKRTLTASVETATWSAADIATDFPSGLAGAYLLIQQESAVVGWGTAARYDF